MEQYRAPQRDISFILEELVGYEEHCKLPGFEHATTDVVNAVLTQGAKFFEDVVAPTNSVADEEGVVYKEQIPEAIHALNQKAISLKGFMLPLKVEQGLVTEMLIMRDQSMCCYGTVPKINEWVSVRMEEEGVKPVMDEPVTIYGTLKVGEVLENGYLVGIYEMDGQSMSVEKIDQ